MSIHENDETMISGWTDAEIDAYNEWLDEQERYADAPTFPGHIDMSEPPF